jgi:FtsZ-interacting cell division protein YlmF
MGIKQAAVRGFKNIWSHGDDEDYERDEDESSEASDPAPRAEPSPSGNGQKFAPPSYQKPTYGGGGGQSGGARRVPSPVALPLRAREKNIYTLKPKSQEEASVAADYLKTGSAVVVNLDEVERLIAVRIIDFMSGVCYGLDNQGHAMKLGDTIFLFTPGDFEISSDEPSYSENAEFFFKDVPNPKNAVAAPAPTAASPLPNPAVAPPFERSLVERPTIERPTLDRPARPWER